MSIKNKLLGGAVLLMSAFSLNEVQATDCAVPPTCAQLGYTMKKADCGEYPVMRCPFALSDDNQVYCEGTVKVAALPILYGDGTVSKKLITGKTPIGVVFDETNRLAVALTDVKKDGSAGREAMACSNNSYTISNMDDCSKASKNDSLSTCAVDGRANTNKILACGTGCGGTPAATAVNSYQPAGCTAAICKKTKWFLPSMRDLNNIYQVKASINSILVSLGGQDLTGAYYWSSVTKHYSTNMDMYVLNMSLGSSNSIDSADSYKQLYTDFVNIYVRPVVKY